MVVRLMEWDNVFIILIIAKDVPTLNPSKHSPCPQPRTTKTKMSRAMVSSLNLKYHEEKEDDEIIKVSDTI